jgi:hypothetical protein
MPIPATAVAGMVTANMEKGRKMIPTQINSLFVGTSFMVTKDWILSYFCFFLTGFTGFSGYLFQAFQKKAWKHQSPSAINKTIL